MKKVYTLLVLALTLFGVAQLKAETLTEDFESVTLTDADGNPLTSSWSYGYGLSNGWKVVGGNIFSSAGSANYGLWTNGHESSKSLEASYSASNSAFVVIPTKLTGELKFWSRKTSSSSSTKGTVNIYEVEADGDSYKQVGTLYSNNTLTTTWTEYTVDLGDEGKLIAINMVRAGIDDISAEVFEEGADVKALSITAFEAAETAVVSDESGNYSLSFNVTLENTGTVDITSADNVTVSILDESKTAVAESEVITLAAGEEKVVMINYDGTASGDVTLTFYAKESLKNRQFATAITVEVTKAGPRFAIDTDGTVQDFGFIAAGETSEKSYTITNSGTSVLSVTAITVPTGYNAPTSMAVAAGETADFTVSMTNSQAGICQGNVVLTHDLGTFTIPVDGYVYAADVEHLDFSALPSRWEVGGSTRIEDGSLYFPYAGYGSTNTLTSPAIVMPESGKLAIRGMLYASYGNFTLNASTDGGSTWSYSKLISGFNTSNYTTVEITDLPADVTNIRLQGSYFYIDDVAGFNYNENAPVMEVTLNDAAVPEEDNFGKLTADATHTYTVANTGTGTLVVNVASDSPFFTVEPTHLEVAGGESDTFDVTFKYSTRYGEKTGTITITPENEGVEALSVVVKATAKDPSVWEEDFEGTEGNAPTGWSNTSWTFGSYSSYSGTDILALAPNSSTAASIVTPSLNASAGDVLTWDAWFNWYDEPLIVEYSIDNKETWTQVINYKPQDDGVETRFYKKEMSFTAPEDGIYNLRFTSTYQNGLDNFYGFRLKNKAHDVAISSSTIPADAYQYAEYTAEAELTELLDKEENVVLTLYVDGEAVATEEGTLGASETATFQLTYTPEVATEAAVKAYIEVVYSEISVKTDEVDVTIHPALVLSDTDETVEIVSGTYPSVLLNYDLKSGWNTIALPFNLDNLSVFGEGIKAYEFTDFDASTGVITVKPTTSTLYGGYAYIFYVEEATENQFKFFDVNISRTQPQYDQHNGAYFRATYTPIAAPNMAGLYGVVPSTGKIMKGGSGASLKGFRGYFEMPADYSANECTFFFSDSTTSITAAELFGTGDGEVYDLAGRKITGQLRPGIYVKNGKKFVVK